MLDRLMDVFLSVVVGFAAGFIYAVILFHVLRPRFRLNLKIEGKRIMNIGDTATAKIAPTDPSGVVAPVTSVVFTVTPAGAYTIAPSSDGLSAVYTAAVAGTGNVATVTAVNSAGSTLNDTKPLPDVAAATPVASALNLSVTTP